MFIVEQMPIVDFADMQRLPRAIVARACRLICTSTAFVHEWNECYSTEWNEASFWYPEGGISIEAYGPAHERACRLKIRESTPNLERDWSVSCGVHDRTPEFRDIGDRAQLRAEIDAYVAHLYGLSRDDFEYILGTFPVLERKERAAFGEFMSKRKCLEEYDRIATIL